MSSLTGQKIKDTYQSLLKTDDNGLITTAFKNITDGSGSSSGLYLQKDGIKISGSLIVTGSIDITGSLTVNTINVGQNTLNFIDSSGVIINSISVASGSSNILISTGSIQSTSNSYFSGSFTGSLEGTSSYALTASYALNGGGSVDLSGYTTTGSFNSFTSSINTFTQSVNSNINALNNFSSSINSFTQSVNSNINSLNNFSSSILSWTGSTSSQFAGTASWADSASNAINSQTASYLNNLNQNLTVTGNIIINGTASADYLRVNYIESASIIYSSGSNQFGDATNDTQSLFGRVIVTGSLEVTGSTRISNLTGSLFGTASWAYSASNAINAQTSFRPINVTGSTIYSTNPVSITTFNAATTNNNIFLGLAAGRNVIGVKESIFLGGNAGDDALYAFRSNFIGWSAGGAAFSASYSNFIGYTAGDLAYYASNSNFLGNFAGGGADSASYSTLIGYRVGANGMGNSINSNNIIIGTNITLPAGAKDSINIGGIIFGTGSYSDVVPLYPYSGSAGGRIGINVANPQYEFDVSGSTQISDVLILPPQDPLPSGKPTGSLAVSGSGADCKIYFFNGSWNALF